MNLGVWNRVVLKQEGRMIMMKALIGIGMLAVACFVCGPAMALTDVPHAPVASCPNGTGPFVGVYHTPAKPGDYAAPYGAPIGGTYLNITAAGSMPVFDLLVAPEETPPTYIYPVNYWPDAGAWDFCAAFDTASCSLGALSSFSTDILAYQNLFFCGGADGTGIDINGPVNLDPPSGQLPVSKNGIPDGQYELGLLAAILNNTYTLDPTKTGGKTNAMVLAAFKTNFAFFQQLVTQALANVPLNKPPAPPSDLRSMVPSLAPFLPSALVTILTGYATEGDAQSVGALDTLLGLLGQIGITPPVGGVAGNTTGFAAILGPDGDADGDGFSNRQEYNYFKSQGPAVAIHAELDPATVPPVGVIILGGGKTVEEGTSLTLTAATLPGTTALTFAWTKEGSATVLGTAQQLVISVLKLSDAGKYIVSITTDAQGTTVSSQAVSVKVVASGQLPIAGGLGLALLAGACALGGVGSIRRRK
jgi:hypothetical protein